MSERNPGKRKTRPATGKEPGGGGGATPSARAGSPMDVGLLEQMVRLMAANDLNTVDVRDGDRRVILKRGAPVVQYAGPLPMAAPHGQAAAPAPPAAGAPAAAAAAGGPAPPAGDAGAAAEAQLVPIKSPMVGTFYAAPKQGEKPYVSVGSAVNEESDVCIIEAMKVFNVIKAETSGTIAKVLIQDGQPVEHGTVRFLVKP